MHMSIEESCANDGEYNEIVCKVLVSASLSSLLYSEDFC